MPKTSFNIEFIGLNLNTTFKISLTGNIFVAPTASSAGLISSDVILRTG